MNNYLTVFTATYNRKNLLNNLYMSLKRQTNKQFEWIIIDDASDDGTDKLVEQWIKETNAFPIYFERQNHGGKHRAINRGIDIASGDFFFIVDSDDMLTNNAIELVLSWIGEINDKSVIGVAGLCVFKNGKICGGNFETGESKYITASNLERIKYGLNGDKAEVYKTEILKENKFPTFEDEYFITEAVCWNAIASKGGKLNWYNKPIYVCEYLDGGLSKTGANEIPGRLKNFKGYCYYINQSLTIKKTIEAVTDFRAYNKTCKFRGDSFFHRAVNIKLSTWDYCLWFFIKLPFYYFLRIFKKVVGLNYENR